MSEHINALLSASQLEERYSALSHARARTFDELDQALSRHALTTHDQAAQNADTADNTGHTNIDNGDSNDTFVTQIDTLATIHRDLATALDQTSWHA